MAMCRQNDLSTARSSHVMCSPCHKVERLNLARTSDQYHSHDFIFGPLVTAGPLDLQFKRGPFLSLSSRVSFMAKAIPTNRYAIQLAIFVAFGTRWLFALICTVLILTFKLGGKIIQCSVREALIKRHRHLGFLFGYDIGVISVSKIICVL